MPSLKPDERSPKPAESRTPEPTAPASTLIEEVAAAVKAAVVKVPVCPHCGAALREHHDTLEALHCDAPACVNCCFVLGPDGPVIRPGAPHCPATERR